MSSFMSSYACGVLSANKQCTCADRISLLLGKDRHVYVLGLLERMVDDCIVAEQSLEAVMRGYHFYAFV